MNGKETQLLQDLMNAQTEILKAEIKAVHVEIQNTDKKLTGRHAALIDTVQENTSSIKKLKKETTFFRWLHNNPMKAFIIFSVCVLGITTLFSFQDVIDIIKDIWTKLLL